MKKNICFGLSLTLALVVGVNAQSSSSATNMFKITKVGNDENQSFDVILNKKVVTEAKQGDWPEVSPIVPDGKMFKSFTVYDEYGETTEDQKVSATGRNGMRFLMPKHEVFVKVSYESLRYMLFVEETENGTVSLSFNDRYGHHSKPGTKVTVNPNAANGYKVSSIKVSKYLDSKTTVTCTKNSTPTGPGTGVMGPGALVGATEGSCTFEMPNYDVNVTATFVADSVQVHETDLKHKKFNVTYELNGGTLDKDAAKSFECTEMAKLPTPTKDGFDFVGWSLENKLDNVYYAIDALDGSACSDVTVYAIWTVKGTCLPQSVIAVDSVLPVCSSNLKCALFHSNVAKADSLCNGIVWTTDMSILSSSSSVVSSSSVAASSSSAKPASSSVAASSPSAKPASSSVAASSSSAKPASSSAAASSSSAKPASSSVAASSSSANPASSSVAASSSSAKPASSSVAASSSSAMPASSSVAASSSSAKPASSSAAASSSSAKPASSSVAASSSSAKPASSSAKATSSSDKAKSSSSVELDVESVKTEEDLPSCTSKRENVTYYVSELKKVFVCKDRKWTQFDPNGIPVIAHAAKFSAAVNGRQLQVSGAKVGSQVNLLDLQGRVVYSGQANAANFTMNLARSGTFVIRIGTQQKIVNVR